MPVGLSADYARLVGSLEVDLRAAAEAIGVGMRSAIADLTPALVAAEGVVEPTGELLTLDLDHEGTPDGLSLTACLAAHRAYVSSRGRAEAISVGALPIARLMVWAQRATLLGAAPRLLWVGPAVRAPAPGTDQLLLRARCAVAVAGTTRRAEAAAIVAGPARGT